MKTVMMSLLGAALLATPVLAEGDPVAGEKAFKQCISCHVVKNDEGETLAGRNARTGPNLYGVIGRQAGTVEKFRYGKSLVKAGEEGLVWNEETFLGYVQDPTKWLKAHLDDRKARGKMTYKVRKEQDAKDLYAFLAQWAAPATN